MTFPESTRVTYGKNPLIEVICQLRFPTILRIGVEQPADFQGRIRQEYPLYTLQEPSIEFPQLPKELSAVIEQLNLPRPPGSATHRFSTADSKRLISLSQNFMALTESVYETWESFRGEMEKAERALREIYSPAFYSRIGLRYKNMIRRSNLGLTEAKWKDLLQPHIIGELGAAEVSDTIVATETRSVIRTPEVAGGQVKLDHRLVKLSETGEECYIIDADFWIERKEDLGGTFEVLDEFNKLTGRLFRWAITDTLHNAMEPTRI